MNCGYWFQESINLVNRNIDYNIGQETIACKPKRWYLNLMYTNLLLIVLGGRHLFVHRASTHNANELRR